MAEGEKIIQVNIEEEMKTAYIDYSMSVIVSRALPDVRDGLKPVHRRVLFGMQDLGVRATGSHKKSARIVGEVLGKYHPHGDTSVYDSMVRMAQEWSLRYPLVDGQGNFGSVDGDSPAAMRYTEARLKKIAEEMLADLDKETVDFSLNFDDTLANILKPHISCTLTEQFLTAEYLMKVSGTLNTQHTLINDLRDNIPNDNIPNDNTSNNMDNENMDNENMDNENMDNENMDNDKESHLIQLQEEYDKINQLRYEHTTQRTLSQRTLSPQ